MAQSIQRGNEWWHQRPDGVWLKWSADTQTWMPQQGGPPAPSPENPLDASTADFPPTQGRGPSAAPRPQTGVGYGGATEDKSKKQPSIAKQALLDSLADPTSAPPANTPTFSKGKRGLPPIRESKVLLGIVAGILILGAFTGTYLGATAFFAKGSSVANAQEPMRTPKGYSKAKWAYILKMDDYCRESQMSEHMKELGEELRTIESEDEALGFVEELRDKYNESIAEFRNGSLPRQDRPLLDKIFVLHDTGATYFDRIIGAIEDRNVTEMQAVATEAIGTARLEVKLMGRYGFQVCGKSPF